MNKDNAKKFLPLVQALADGKTIQQTNGNGYWHDLDDGVNFIHLPETYRIKPEPREFWVNIYNDGWAGYSYPSFNEAKRAASIEAKTIKVREILDQ